MSVRQTENCPPCDPWPTQLPIAPQNPLPHLCYPPGVHIMATPHSPAALQTRTELLAGMGAVYKTLRCQLTAGDLSLYWLHWPSRFAWYPFGVDDISSQHATGVLPLQKSVLTILSQLVPMQVCGSSVWLCVYVPWGRSCHAEDDYEVTLRGSLR